jgi:RNA exonuclease 4
MACPSTSTISLSSSNTNIFPARTFKDVIKQVAGLIKDRIVVGHAIHNDLKALLLTHPHSQLRDTQVYAKKFNLTRSSHIALRHLVKQELGITIQEGEHDSVADSRATMAIFRLHQKEWEAATSKPKPTPAHSRRPAGVESDPHAAKRKPKDPEPEKLVVKKEFPGGGRKGVSSGLSTVTKSNRKSDAGGDWWKQLPSAQEVEAGIGGGRAEGSKGSIRI